ncbi:uncharacterized protein [Haliotis asinina]|uniref:uncharacterized protein n=1 Tax=Haliotis asinina TaxID=109174 RepID=UPI0035322139
MEFFLKLGSCKKCHLFKLDENIEVVKEYIYLGILFNNNGCFCKGIKRLHAQASRAMYAVLRKIRMLDMPLDCQLKMFDQIVQPILLYASEVWGYENTQLIERLHLKFCKYILKVKMTTPDYMVYGELGRYPLDISIKIRMLSHWCKMLVLPHKLSSKIYSLMYTLKSACPKYTFNLLSAIENILRDTGFYHVWMSQCIVSPNVLKTYVKRVLIDQFYQSWNATANASSKGKYYILYKEVPNINPNLLDLPPGLRIWYTRFRTANHRLPIETGRWTSIAVCDGKCTLCNDAVGDEYHFLVICSGLATLRNKYLPRYFCNNPSLDKFISIMKSHYKPLTLKLAKYIKEASSICCSNVSLSIAFTSVTTDNLKNSIRFYTEILGGMLEPQLMFRYSGNQHYNMMFQKEILQPRRSSGSRISTIMAHTRAALNKSVTPLLIPYTDYKANIRSYIGTRGEPPPRVYLRTVYSDRYSSVYAKDYNSFDYNSFTV